MSAVVERIAEALADEQILLGFPAWEYCGEGDKEEWRNIVRATLKAMREVVPVVRDHEGFPAHQLVGAPEDIWRTLLDASLLPKADQ